MNFESHFGEVERCLNSCNAATNYHYIPIHGRCLLKLNLFMTRIIGQSEQDLQAMASPSILTILCILSPKTYFNAFAKKL